MKNKKIMLLCNFIMKFRYLFLCLLTILIVICSLNINNTKIYYNLDYLKLNNKLDYKDKFLKNEFGYNELKILIYNINYQNALNRVDSIKNIKGVKKVFFNDSINYYKDNNALIIIEMKNNIKDDIINIIRNDHYYIYNSDKLSINNLTLIIIISVILLLILLVISISYFDIIIFIIIFCSSIIINLGSNNWFGNISIITQIVSLIFQIYMIFYYYITFIKYYKVEIDNNSNIINAIKLSLYKFIKEISLNFLIIVLVLISLLFMKYSIGKELFIYLTKSIICSLIIIIFLFPSLLFLFNKIILKLRKRNIFFNLNIYISSRKILLPLFFLIVFISIFLMSKCNLIYNANYNNINNIFNNNRLEIIVNKDNDYYKEFKIANKLLQDKRIINVYNIGNTKIDENIILGNMINYEEFSKLFNIDIDNSINIYKEYATKNNEVINDLKKIQISIYDLIYFLYDNKILNDELNSNIINYYTQINELEDLYESKKYSRFIIDINSEIENEDTYKLIDMIKEDVEKEYDNVLLIGKSVTSKYLKDIFKYDKYIIFLIFIILVFTILFVIYKSIILNFIIIMFSYISVLINFGFLVLLNKNIFFLIYLIVWIFLMIITINNNIIISKIYQKLKYNNKMISTKISLKNNGLNIIINNLIIVIILLLAGFNTNLGLINSLCIYIALGIIIQTLLTLFIFPIILYTFDKYI